MRIESLRAVAFDLDSTLCQYALTVEEVLVSALERAGFGCDAFGAISDLADDYNSAWWTAEEQSRVPTGELRRRAWAAVLEKRGLSDEAVSCRLADAYGAIREESGVSLFEGVKALLSDLRDRYRLGILTNGPSDMQWGKLRHLDLTESVDGIVVAGDVGIFKPDPRVFRRLLDILDVDAGDALFVGNSYEHDIAGASAAGMRTAWVTDGQGPPGESVSFDLIVERVTDLREVLL